MKYPNVAFPSGDKLWVEVYDFFAKNNISFSETSVSDQATEVLGTKVLAPIEFFERIPTVLPYHFSFTNSVKSFDFVIVSSTQYKQIYTPFLKEVIQSYNLVFNNPLFCIYTNRNDIAVIHSSIKKLLFQFPDLQIPRIFSRRNRSIRKIALVSANKFGNLGDDAVTWASYDSLKRVFPKSIIKIYRPPVFRWQIFQADLLVLGGGGLFYDGCFYNAMNYTRYIAWAKEANIPSCALGIGTQGIKTSLGKELYKNILDFCEFISVRDKLDAEILRRDIGVKAPIYITQDMAFSLRRQAKKTPHLKENGKPIMLFSLIDTNAMRASKRMQSYRQTSAKILREWSDCFNIWCVVQSESDTPLYIEHSAKQKLIRIPFNDIGQAIAIYKQADVVLTSRFHGLILALLSQTPVIATGGRQGKIYRLIYNSLPLMKHNYIPITDFTEEEAKTKIQELLSNKSKFVVQQEALDDCIKSSLLNENLLMHYRNIWNNSQQKIRTNIPPIYN